MILVPLAGVALAVAAAASEEVWDPRALATPVDAAAYTRDPRRLPGLVAEGRRLFLAHFNVLDGVGRPGATGDGKPTRRLALPGGPFDRSTGPDATSCVSCHNQGGPGGGGDLSASVFVTSATRYVASTPDQGFARALRRPPSIFGAGAVEMLAREATAALHAQRDAALARARASGREEAVRLLAKTVDFGSIVARPDGTYDAAGVAGIDADLVVRPFGWRGQSASLREFTVTALNQHHGLQAVERYGWERTGRRDFDDDGVTEEVSAGQVTALVAFLASLPPPVPRAPEDPAARAAAERGAATFQSIGCAECHRPALPLDEPTFVEPGPYNAPGTLTRAAVDWELRLPLAMRAGQSPARRPQTPKARAAVMVRAFTDLRRHAICDAEDAFLCDSDSLRDGRATAEFMTARLWAVGSGAPYSHRGDCSTLSEIIRHHSAEGAPARRAFLALPDASKRDLIAFLLTLGAAS
jgi:mono/diheme cytochrome c family protein